MLRLGYFIIDTCFEDLLSSTKDVSKCHTLWYALEVNMTVNVTMKFLGPFERCQEAKRRVRKENLDWRETSWGPFARHFLKNELLWACLVNPSAPVGGSSLTKRCFIYFSNTSTNDFCKTKESATDIRVN